MFEESAVGAHGDAAALGYREDLEFFGVFEDFDEHVLLELQHLDA
jgi:hypothetical protein